MTQYTLGTVGFEIQNTGGAQATAELTNLANVATTKLGPAAERIIQQLEFVKRANEQVAASTQAMGNSWSYFSTQQLQQTSQRLEGFEMALANTRQGMNEVGVITQQLGYQIGDFLVQVQSGTNAFVAFGQQATQLVGFLPLLSDRLNMSVGTLVGLSTVLGIAIPLVTALGALYMRAGENAEQASGSILSLANAQKELNSAAEDYAVKLEMLRFGVDTQAEAVALKEIFDLTTQIQRLNREYQQTDSLSRRQAIAEEVLGLKEQLSTQQSIVDEVNSKRQAYETALAINKQMQAVELAHARAIGDAKREQEAMTEAASSALEKYSMMRTVAAGLANNLAAAADATAAAVSRMNQLSTITYSGRGGDPRQFVEGGEQSYTENFRPFVFDESLDNKTRGGAGGSGGANARLDSLINQLQTEREVLDEWYATSQETLMTASENELQIIGGYNEAKIRLEQEYQERLRNIRSEYGNANLQDTANLFGQLANIASVGGQKTAKAVATFQAIEGTINAYGAAIKALNTPGISLAGRFAAYASVLAAGLRGVAAIKAAGGSGGGVGAIGVSGSVAGTRGSATVAPTAPAPTAQTVFIDSIDPDSLYSGQTLINLFDAFYDENDKRGKVFVVAR